jgi:hypothetical protein
MSSTRSLLADLRPSEISTTPFPHLAAVGVAPPETYATLQSTFPSLATLASGRRLDQQNAALRMSSKAVLRNPAIDRSWKDFFELHISAAHWRDIVQLFGDTIRTTFPQLEERVGKPLSDFRVGSRGETGSDINLECQFVINTPSTVTSSVKTPHVDKRQTLFAGMYYLRVDDDLTAGGNLELYAWKRPPRFLPYRMILPGDVQRVTEIPYAGNTLVCFTNSPAAIHGVSPREPGQVLRRYINLVAEMRYPLFRTPLISVPAAMLNWTEIRSTRRKQLSALSAVSR